MNTSDTDMMETSSLEQVLVLTWCLGCGFSSVFGNSLVLVAVFRYGAIKLDKVAVCLISNLAMVDLMFGVFIILPTIGVLISGTWLYGTVYCYMTNYLESYLATLSILLLLALNITKLTGLLFPFSRLTRTKRSGYKLACAMWGAALLPLVPDAVYRRTISYSSEIYRCDDTALPHVDWWLNPLKSSILVFIPVIVISISTIWLIFFVHKVRGLQKQSVITAILISVVFIASFLPFGVILVLGDDFSPHVPSHLFLYKIGVFISFLNHTANPPLYLITVPCFRDFVKYQLLGVARPAMTTSGVSSRISTSIDNIMREGTVMRTVL